MISGYKKYQFFLVLDKRRKFHQTIAAPDPYAHAMQCIMLGLVWIVWVLGILRIGQINWETLVCISNQQLRLYRKAALQILQPRQGIKDFKSFVLISVLLESFKTIQHLLNLIISNWNNIAMHWIWTKPLNLIIVLSHLSVSEV